MKPDAELENWRVDWQSESAAPLDLRRKVQRQSRLMKVGLAGDILVTIVIGGGATVLAVRSALPDAVVLAIATWSFLAAAWTFVLRASRGTWSHSGMDAAGFLDLAIRRCRRSLAAVWFAGSLFLIEIVFCVGWVYRHLPQPRPPLWAWLFGFMDWIWVGSLLFFWALRWYRNRKRAELRYLLDARRETGR